MTNPHDRARHPGGLLAMLATAVVLGGAMAASQSSVDMPGAVRFSDASELLPVREPQRGPGRPGRFVGYGPLWLDADGDGDTDLFYLNHGLLPSLFENRRGAVFVDRSLVAGLRTGDWQYPQQGDRHGASCGDFDNDGLADIHIGHGAKRGETLGIKRDELLRGIAPFVWRDVSQAAGVTNGRGRGRLAAWADYDGDGWLDLYVINYRSSNIVYRNRGDGTFEDVTERLGMEMDAHVASWADYDADGDADLLQAFPLRLMRNDGNGRFEDVTRETRLGRIRAQLPLGLAWQDFDNDGDPDVFVSARNSAGRLLVNENGRFRPFAPEMSWGRVPGTHGNGATWGDVDNDGWPDLVLTRSNGLALFMNRQGRRFDRVRFAETEEFDMDHGGEAALADFDGDGFLDAAFNSVGRNHLFRNRGGDGAWLIVSFEGRASNRPGFGVRITAEGKRSDGRSLRVSRQYFGDNGVFRSVGCAPLHLGLADVERVDLTVEWPSGLTQQLDDVPVNRRIRITEPPVPQPE